MANSELTALPSYSGADGLQPARRLNTVDRGRRQASIVTFDKDNGAQTSESITSSFSSVYTLGCAGDAPRGPRDFRIEAPALLDDWPLLADAPAHPPPPNTPAGHLVWRRQSLLHDAFTEYLQKGARSKTRRLLENLPFRIDPISKVIRNGSLINFGSELKLPWNGGYLDDGQDLDGPGPKRANWRNLLPAQSYRARVALRLRKRSPKTDAELPRAILKRKVKAAALWNYAEQLCENKAERAKIKRTNAARAKLQHTCNSLNQPHNQVIAIKLGETLEEKVKSELAARDGKPKRLSWANTLTKRTTSRITKFVENLPAVAVDQESIKSADFVMPVRRRKRLGFFVKAKIVQLREKVQSTKAKVRGKFAKEPAEEDKVPLLTVNF